METCAFEDLRGHILLFHDENVLIVNAKSKELKEACGHYRQYKLCMRPKRKACPEGNQLLQEMDDELRIYLLKMEIICDKRNRKVYSSNIDCYQNVLERNLLHQCHLVWLETWPLLSTITAHKFYCETQSKTSQKITSQLTDLQKCYAEVFSNQCGLQSGALLSTLAQQAFQDPHFLRFNYKPNCTLHSVDQTETKTPIITTTASHIEVLPCAGIGENHESPPEMPICPSTFL
ncbi:hypothetical protein CAPTEDRAFT_227364 [Capitella teleta]|uniref:Uncharacterized protein n=1 Tax=Capitella teleta TaxID=283909 RepID=R7T6I7_CAPTE|nr:hypothetical protein CAPTEDRAFT_227364 [Capitella teleta]|eukprot:ELT89184.1 hypothetical protein CAPTEDRAFT_227364 [Capitella teleta]